MDEKTLTRLLRPEATEVDQPGRDCPDEAQLAAFVERRIPDQRRARIEAHVADCEACLGQVAFLARQPAGLPAAAPAGAVTRARDLLAPTASLWRPLVVRWGTAAAAVACMVLVAVIVLRTPVAPQVPVATPAPGAVSAAPAEAAVERAAAPRVPPPLDFARGGPEQAPKARPAQVEGPRMVRKSTPAAAAPSVVAPSEDATLARQSLEFRWRPVPGSLYYEIDVVTDEGTVVWRSRVEGTSVRPPDGLKLDAGTKYFVWAKAFLSVGETVRSAAVSFHIAGQ